jgi:DNA-binding CsgD family transcriptional regulator
MARSSQEPAAEGRLGRNTAAEEVGLQPATQPLMPGSAPLAGRDAELGTLRALLERAGGGEAHLAAVAGEPGVGKTRLLGEVAALAAEEGWLVLQGGAYESQRLSPYQPFVEALRGCVDAFGAASTRRLAGAWTAQLARLLPELASSRKTAPAAVDDPEALFEAVTALLRRLAEEQPVLLTLDDLQWADTACLDLLLYARRRLRRARLLMLAAYREAETPPDDALRAMLVELNRLRLVVPLHLARLDAQATAALAGGLLRGQVGSRLAAGVYRESEGNPFVAEEVVRALAEQGRLACSESVWDILEATAVALPPSVRDAARARFRLLSPETLGLLQAASVLGREFSAEDLARLRGLTELAVAEGLVPAAQRGLVEAADQAYRFSHDTIREALYRDLLPPQRRQLHQQAALLLQAQGAWAEAAQVAYHFLRSPQPRQAVPFLLADGERALTACAYRYAAEQFGAAAGLLREAAGDDVPRESRQALAAGLLREAAGGDSPQETRLALAGGLLREAARGDAPWDTRLALAETLLRHGSALAAAGQYDDALVNLGEALSVAQRLEAEAGTGQTADRRPPTAEGTDAARVEGRDSEDEAGLGLAGGASGPRAQVEDETGRAVATLVGQIYERLGGIYLAREEPDQAERALRQALDALGAGEEARRARVLLRLGQLYVSVTGQLEEGERRLDAALAFARREADARLETEAVTALGQAAMHRGDFPAGRALFEQALAAAEPLNDPGLTGLASDGLARLHYWTAAFHDLHATARRELAFARRTGDPHRLGWPSFWLTQASLQLGRWREAESHIERLIRLGEELGARRFLAQGHELRGLLAHLRGETAEALAELSEAVAQFRAIGPGALVYYLGPYCLALLEAAETVEASTTLDELLHLARRHPMHSSPRVQACNVAALALLRLGRAEEAIRLYQELLPAERQNHWHIVARTLGIIATADRRWEAAARHLAVAREMATSGGGRIELANVLLAEAGLLLARGQPGRAEALQREARRLLEACGAHPGLARLEAGPRAAPAPGGLSPRELEVLRLVAEGQTNREIAAALSISEKTAINHLTHIFNKLGCDNRAAATAFALRHGLV